MVTLTDAHVGCFKLLKLFLLSIVSYLFNLDLNSQAVKIFIKNF